VQKIEVFGGSVQMRISRNFMLQVWKPCIICKTQVAMLRTSLSCMSLPVRYKELWGVELLLSLQREVWRVMTVMTITVKLCG